MILHIQSDASYLSRPEARSIAGGIFYVGNHDQPTTINGAISHQLDAVVASVAEAEYAALFLNGQEGASLRHIINALEYPQPATVILFDNKCAYGIATDKIKPKRKKKNMDMKFHWIRGHLRQGQFRVMWGKGVDNLADFFTNAMPVHEHKRLMKLLIQVPPAKGIHTQTRHTNKSRLTERVC